MGSCWRGNFLPEPAVEQWMLKGLGREGVPSKLMEGGEMVTRPEAKEGWRPTRGAGGEGKVMLLVEKRGHQQQQNTLPSPVHPQILAPLPLKEAAAASPDNSFESTCPRHPSLPPPHVLKGHLLPPDETPSSHSFSCISGGPVPCWHRDLQPWGMGAGADFLPRSPTSLKTSVTALCAGLYGFSVSQTTRVLCQLPIRSEVRNNGTLRAAASFDETRLRGRLQANTRTVRAWSLAAGSRK